MNCSAVSLYVLNRFTILQYTVFLKQFYLCMFLPSGKILIIGGSIANFTNVAATFKVSDCSEVSANAHSRHPQAVLPSSVLC